jgi:hypothetical protein
MSTERVTVQAAESVEPRWERVAGGAVTRTRAAAALGLLSMIVFFVGFFIHGYPAMGATGKEIVHWATTTDERQFAIGIYVEALGTLLFLLFAAWLRSVARVPTEAPGGSAPPVSAPLPFMSVSASWITASGLHSLMVAATERARGR